MNSALRQALREGRAFPLLQIDLKAKGHSLGTWRFSTIGTALASGPQAEGRVPKAGFGKIDYGAGLKGQSTLRVVRTGVKVADEERELRALLETYDPRGSVYRIWWAARDLVEADWEPLFIGVLEDWEIQQDPITLIGKVDEGPLRAPAPKPIFSRSDWPFAQDPTTWNTTMPILFGYHDSFKINARGMAPLTNVVYDVTAGYKWSIGMWRYGITRIYFDGVEQGSTWTSTMGVYGGVLQTLVSFPEGSQPEKGIVMSFDGRGPDVNGLLVGVPVTNPAQQLRIMLVEFIYTDRRFGDWTGGYAPTEQALWTSVEAFLDLHGYESSARIGGEGDRPAGMLIVEDFLKSNPCMRAWWTPKGTIGLMFIRPDDDDPAQAQWFDANLLTSKEGFKFIPGDKREVYTGVIMDYLYSWSEGKFQASFEVDDLSAAEDQLVMKLQNTWTQSRYDLST